MNIFRFKSVAILLMTIAVFTTAKAGTLYVASGGAGTGTSWSDPLGDIQSAVDTAVTDDTILLAGGTYAVSSPITIGKTVFIRGGYDPATGQPGATPTVVTRAGDATTRLVSVSGVSGGELRDVTLSGGVLYPAADHAYGAGIQISDSTGYALVNCTVSGNKAQSVSSKNACGGGVAVVNASSASLTDCSIFDNEVENVGKGGNYACGAGLYVAAGCSAAVTNGVIARNNVVFGQNSQRGAGVYTEGAVSLFNCLVYNNVCRGSQNNVLGDGLCAYNGAASLALDFCTVAFNGTCGLYRHNGAVSASDSILWGNGDDVNGTVTLTRCNVADGDSTGVNGNISAEPKFVFGFRLDAASPCLDQSALTAAEAGLDGRTTLASGATDSGFADLGWHAPAAAVDASAADLHVAATGSDATGDGSSGAPFASVTKALTLAAPGTTIHVGEGTFNADSGEVFPWVFDKALDVAIAGAGAELTVFDAGGADASIARMTNSTCIAFSGATFTGTAYGPVLELVPAYGGAIGAFASCGAVIDSCAIRDNELRPYANSSHAFGGGAGFYASGEALVTNCVVKGNVANARHTHATYAYGGGLYFAKTEGRLVGCRVQGNRIQFAQNARRGGGVCNERDSNVAVELVNCLVVGNTAYTSRGVGEGDGLWGRFTIRHSTVAANPGGGKGVKVNGAVTAIDSIFYANGGDFNGKPTLTYCNTQDGLQVGVNGNISVDPLFDRGYYLDASSLCRDAGSAPAGASAVAGLTTSADGAADGGTVDMGFHHMTGLASDYAAIYVSGVGSDANDGKTVGAPFRTLTKALSMAEDGSAIHVAAGLYDAAAGETFPLVANGIAGLCLVGDGPAQVLVDAGGGDGALALQNCPNAVVQGMSFKNAIRTTSNGTDAHAYGGGLALLFSGGVVVENCAFENNKVSSASKGAYGGGAGLFASTATIRGCRFIGNDVASNSGTSYAYGGGVANAGGVLTLVNSELRFNSISVGSNGRLGAGLYANSTTTASNCLVVGNCAWSTTDKAWGDGVYFEGSGTFAIRQCTIAANAGMGLSVHGPTVSLSDTILWGNGLDVYYRNIYSTLNLTRCVYGGHHLEQSDYAGVSARFNAADCATADPLFGPDFSLSVESPYAASAVVLGYQREGGARAVVDIHVAPTGSDETGNGSVGAPYRTLTKAASCSADNAVIHIGAGSYDAAAGEVFPVVFEKIASLRLVGAGETDTIIDGTGANQGLLSFITVADVQVSGLTFTGANAVSAGVDAKQGGAVAVVRSGGMVFRDCRFADNTFDVATSSYGGGVGFDRSSALVERCWMTDNTVKSGRNVYGGGIGAYGGTLDVVACVVVSNKIVTSDWGARGGGVCFHETCGGLLRNSLVVGNQLQSHNEANGVYMAQGHSPQGAAALSKIEHSTILDNVYSAARKFGARVGGSMVNTIVRGHVDDIDGTPTSLTYCNIGDGTFADNLGCQSGDPLFRNSAIGNYTLRTGSPCVDAGCPLPWMDETAVDVYGRPRKQGKGPDIGAAEALPARFIIRVR